MTVKAKRHTGFHYLLTDTRLSNINLSLTICLEYKIMILLCGFYCISFIEYMLEGETLLEYTNPFSPDDYKKNYKIIYKYFEAKYGKP